METSVMDVYTQASIISSHLTKIYNDTLDGHIKLRNRKGRFTANDT